MKRLKKKNIFCCMELNFVANSHKDRPQKGRSVTLNCVELLIQHSTLKLQTNRQS